uniref:Ras-GAP domain-containing protein n=1 Tax=Arcella intermedia TaxID=1963864 RepID=A0A6B2KZB8_9EUKA
MFASVLAGNMEIVRTATVWNQSSPQGYKNPYFYSEWLLPIETSIEHIGVELRDLRKKSNYLIGSVDVPISEKFNSNWYSLKSLSLPGPVHLYLDIKKGQDSSGKDVASVTVQKITRNGKDGCFVVGRYGDLFSKKLFKSDITMSGTWKSPPNWQFEYPTAEEFIILQVFDAFSNDCIGQVTLTHEDIESKGGNNSMWKLEDMPAGSLRIDTKVNVTPVLDDQNYDDLFSLLFEDKMKIIKMTSTTYERKPGRIAESIVRTFEFRRTAVHYLKEILNHEIENTKDPNAIFRNNSLATKSFEIYLKLIALPHLHKMLSGLISDIYKRKKISEMDPTRLDSNMDEKTRIKTLEKNKTQLIETVDLTFKAIFGSIGYLPRSIRIILEEIKKSVKRKFPGDNQVVYSALTGVFFLRFICPAILGPVHYGLQTEHAHATAARELTLITQCIQTITNLTIFGENDSYMVPLNPWVDEQKEAIKKFLDNISELPRTTLDEIPTPHNNINFGKEMAGILQYLDENLELMTKGYSEDPLVSKLTVIIEKLKSMADENTTLTTPYFSVPKPSRPLRSSGLKKILQEGTESESEPVLPLTTPDQETKILTGILLLHQSITLLQTKYAALEQQFNDLQFANDDLVDTINLLSQQKEALQEELQKHKTTKIDQDESQKQKEIKTDQDV